MLGTNQSQDMLALKRTGEKKKKLCIPRLLYLPKALIEMKYL